MQGTEDPLAGKPDPVQRYLRFAGVPGRRVIRNVRLKQRGLFRREQKWLPFTAKQWFTTDPPAFKWKARVRLMPLVNFSVTDAFDGAHGDLRATMLSVFKVLDARGPEVDHGQLLRYLGEMAWFPTAYLSRYVEWQPIDAHSAGLTLRLPTAIASAVVSFDKDYRLQRVSADRHMEENGRFVLRKWWGEFSDYRTVSGLQVPFNARVSWQLDAGDFEYFRADVTEIEYDADRL